MGGKKDQTSSTSTQIPAWLQGIMRPFLSGTATKMSQFQNKGWDVLNGLPLGTSVNPGSGEPTLDQIYGRNTPTEP